MFKTDNPELATLVELAKEVSITDPINWDGLAVSEHEAYTMMAAHIIEAELDLQTANAVIVKLLVENFILNLKLLDQESQ
jgi:hypothetical protein